jgi:hypothetical protein
MPLPARRRSPARARRPASAWAGRPWPPQRSRALRSRSPSRAPPPRGTRCAAPGRGCWLRSPVVPPQPLVRTSSQAPRHKGSPAPCANGRRAARPPACPRSSTPPAWTHGRACGWSCPGPTSCSRRCSASAATRAAWRSSSRSRPLCGTPPSRLIRPRKSRGQCLMRWTTARRARGAWRASCGARGWRCGPCVAGRRVRGRGVYACACVHARGRGRHSVGARRGARGGAAPGADADRALDCAAPAAGREGGLRGTSVLLMCNPRDGPPVGARVPRARPPTRSRACRAVFGAAACLGRARLRCPGAACRTWARPPCFQLVLEREREENR